MQIKTWNPSFTDKESKDLAYWERNVLALHFADPSKGDGWYNDDVSVGDPHQPPEVVIGTAPRYEGWRRVISLQNGSITFHVPDDFALGNLPQIERNWDGHTTEEKWRRILVAKGIK